MTNEDRVAAVSTMSHFELAKLWRFEPIRSEWFQGEVGKRVYERLFTELGGIPTEMSKELGWGEL